MDIILQPATKKRVDHLFLAHTVVSAVAGVIAFLLPHVFEWSVCSPASNSRSARRRHP